MAPCRFVHQHDALLRLTRTSEQVQTTSNPTPYLVDEVLDIAKGLRIERRDSRRKAIDEAFELDVGNGAIDVATSLGKCAIEVLTAEQDLEGPTPADETGQPGCRAASRDGGESDFHLTEHGPLSACEADIASENELAAGAASSPTNR